MASTQASPAALPQLSFAGLGSRVVAHVLDTLIAASVLFLAGFTMRWLHAAGLWTPTVIGVSPETAWRALSVPAKLAVVFSFILSMGPIYGGLFESSAGQATLGKRLLNIYVTNAHGKRLASARALERWFLKVFFGVLGLWFVSMITVAVAQRKQALHDFAAKTLVVRGKPARGSLELWRILAAFGIPYLALIAMYLALF